MVLVEDWVLVQERLASYAAKKSKKTQVIAKSSILLDVKPWDDETDMAELEKCVRYAPFHLEIYTLVHTAGC